MAIFFRRQTKTLQLTRLYPRVLNDLSLWLKSVLGIILYVKCSNSGASLVMSELYLQCKKLDNKRYSTSISAEINAFWRLSGFRTKSICKWNQILLSCFSGGL